MKLSQGVLALWTSFWFAAALVGQAAPAAPTAPAAPVAPRAAATAVEAPLLWRIELPTPSYLFGTIHLPDPRVTTLPDVVADAIDRSGALFTEIPMELAKMTELLQQSLLPKGEHLVDVVGDELYGRIEAYVEGHGVPVAMFDRTKPWVATMQLMFVDQLKTMAGKTPLDLMLYDEAKKDGKTVGGLETPESQVAIFETLTTDEQVSWLRTTLVELERESAAGRRPTEDLLQLYLRGDEAAIDAKINDFPMGDAKLTAKLKKRLLLDRNAAMVDRIVEQLQRHPERSTFVAVGAAHYAGTTGIVRLLQDRGYAITRIELHPGGTAASAEAAAIDAEIARRQAEIAALQARRAKLVLLR